MAAHLSQFLPLFLPLLLLKMAIVASVVVLATMIAERTRPAIAALIATLPLSVGSTYILLAIDHDTGFIAAAALKSVAGAVSTTVFIVVYARAVLRLKPVPALLAAYGTWLPVATIVHLIDWNVPLVLLFAAVMLLVGFAATYPLRSLRATHRAARHWYDPLVRAAGVSLFVGMLTGLSAWLGASVVGTLANFPVIMTSVGLILHLRLGKEAAAGMLANSVAGMVGVCIALLQVHLTIESWGAGVALATGLAICVCWNLMLYLIGQRHALRAAALSR